MKIKKSKIHHGSCNNVTLPYLHSEIKRKRILSNGVQRLIQGLPTVCPFTDLNFFAYFLKIRTANQACFCSKMVIVNIVNVVNIHGLLYLCAQDKQICKNYFCFLHLSTWILYSTMMTYFSITCQITMSTCRIFMLLVSYLCRLVKSL